MEDLFLINILQSPSGSYVSVSHGERKKKEKERKPCLCALTFPSLYVGKCNVLGKKIHSLQKAECVAHDHNHSTWAVKTGGREIQALLATTELGWCGLHKILAQKNKLEYWPIAHYSLLSLVCLTPSIFHLKLQNMLNV